MGLPIDASQCAGVETTSRELVGSSQVPYQLRHHPDENRLSAGMLVQDDKNVNQVLGKLGFKLNSKRKSTTAEYIDLAAETLLSGNAFITTVQRPNDRHGRHAVVFTELRDSHFLGLDPDCRCDRSVDYQFDEVKETVALDIDYSDFALLAKGSDGYVPLLGILTECAHAKPEQVILEHIFTTSHEAMRFFSTVTSNLTFNTEESLRKTCSLLKPVLKAIVTDLRTAIEIRDDCIGEKSKIAEFLKHFESDILEFRNRMSNGEEIPGYLRKGIGESLECSHALLEEHLKFETYREKVALTNA